MHYYYSKHKCSLCFVKEYSIPLVLVSWPCASFFFFKGYCWDTHAEVSQAMQVSYTGTELQMKCSHFLASQQHCLTL